VGGDVLGNRQRRSSLSGLLVRHRRGMLDPIAEVRGGVILRKMMGRRSLLEM
jgi:hypothetical protein